MATGAGSGRSARLIADTCSALKLLAAGDKLFCPGVLGLGDIVIHQRFFNETKRWRLDRRDKYKNELALAARIKAAAGLSVPALEKGDIEFVLKCTVDEFNLSVGAADMSQLTSALHHKLMIITNDEHFSQLTTKMEVNVFTAEDILLEAFQEHLLSLKDVSAILTLWRDNREKRMSRDDEKRFKKIGIAVQGGYIS